MTDAERNAHLTRAAYDRLRGTGSPDPSRAAAMKSSASSAAMAGTSAWTARRIERSLMPLR